MHLLKIPAIMALLALPVFAQLERNLALNKPAAVERPHTAPNTARARDLEQRTFDLLNLEREKRGLLPLKWNDSAANAARTHSTDMSEYRYFSHRDRSGGTVTDRASRQGISKWESIGENIACVRGFADPAATAVENWLLSESHRNNLFNPGWTHSAVGVAIAGDGTFYFTQIFLIKR